MGDKNPKNSAKKKKQGQDKADKARKNAVVEPAAAAPAPRAGKRP